MDEILNILIPLEGFLKQIIEINGILYFLFRIKDEDNVTFFVMIVRFPLPNILIT